MSNITTLGLTVLALMTPSQICEESGIFAEQLQRYRQYGITLTYNPRSLYNATGNRDVNAEYVAAIIKFALSQPVQPTRQLKNMAISRARYQVEALCYKTLRG
jgi:hypothetical protein